jgi:hypothetical protein
MLRITKWMIPAVAALGLLPGMATKGLAAEDKAPVVAPAEVKKGTISGTVQDKDGKAVAGAQVRVVKAAAKPEPKAKKQANAAAGGAVLAAPEDAKAAKAAAKPKAEVLFTAATDAEGKFTIKDVPAGDYIVRTQVKGTGNGQQRVTVTGEQTVTAAIKLKAPAAKAEKPSPKKAAK